MKIKLMSDIHLEFDPTFRPTNNGADVLILAGDICVAEYFKKSETSPYYKVAQQFSEFFHHCAFEFDHVIYVKGNHEAYKGYMDKTTALLKEATSLYDNFHVLDNEVVEINGVKFIGTTLWTNLNNGCPITDSTLRYSMNDYKLIQWSHNYQKLRPMDTFKLHRQALDFIDDNAGERDKVVVVSHHAPSVKSIHLKYVHNHYMNGGYVSSLENFIAWRPQIKLWVHGHVHNNFDYEICDTRVVCNPKGYNNENPEFDPTMLIDLYGVQ